MTLDALTKEVRGSLSAAALAQTLSPSSARGVSGVQARVRTLQHYLQDPQAFFASATLLRQAAHVLETLAAGTSGQFSDESQDLAGRLRNLADQPITTRLSALGINANRFGSVTAYIGNAVFMPLTRVPTYSPWRPLLSNLVEREFSSDEVSTLILFLEKNNLFDVPPYSAQLPEDAEEGLHAMLQWPDLLSAERNTHQTCLIHFIRNHFAGTHHRFEEIGNTQSFLAIYQRPTAAGGSAKETAVRLYLDDPQDLSAAIIQLRKLAPAHVIIVYRGSHTSVANLREQVDYIASRQPYTTQLATEVTDAAPSRRTAPAAPIPAAAERILPLTPPQVVAVANEPPSAAPAKKRNRLLTPELEDLLESITPDSDPFEIAGRLLRLSFEGSFISRWMPSVEEMRLEPGEYGGLAIYDSPIVQAVLIAWPHGATSDVHDHGGSQGVARVIRGNLLETRLQRSRSGQVAPVWKKEISPGEVSAFDKEAIHAMQASGAAGMNTSLHLYWKPLDLESINHFPNESAQLHGRSRSPHHDTVQCPGRTRVVQRAMVRNAMRAGFPVKA